MMVSLAGCGGPAANPSADTSAEASGEASAQVSADVSGQTSAEGSGGTVVIGLHSDWQTMDPAVAYEVFGNLYFYSVYENLFMLEKSDLKDPQPRLAQSYSLDDTGKIYTIELRDGVKFSSGNPMTSADVVFSFNRVKNLKSNTSVHASNVAKVEAPDDKTVVITLAEKDAGFLAKLSNNSFCIVDSKVVKEHGGVDTEDAATTDKATEWLNKNSAGTGPFVLKSWTTNTELVLEKNPSYWGTPAGVDKVIIKEMPDLSSQMQMLESGEIDIAFGLGPEQVDIMKDKPGIQIISKPTSTISFLLMNMDSKLSGPMANPDVQQAVRYALDYKGYLDLAGDGALLPLAFEPNGFIGAKSRPENYQNLEKAKQLMEKAGYKDGFETTLTAATYDSEGMKWSTIAQKAKDDLSKIGITVNIVTGDVTTVINNYREGKVPFLVMHWSPDYYDLNSQLCFIPGNNVAMRANWKAEANQELADMGKQAEGEMNVATRTELAEKMQDIISESSPFAFLIQHPKSFAATDKLDGIYYNDLCKLQLPLLKFK